MARKPNADDALQASEWGKQAVACGALTIAEAAILHFVGMRKRETANEWCLMSDDAISRAVGLSSTTGRSALVSLIDRHILRPVTDPFGSEGVTVCGVHRAAVDRLAAVNMPSNAPRRRASFSVAEVLAEVCT